MGSQVIILVIFGSIFCFAQEPYKECPLPGGSDDTFDEIACSVYSACEWNTQSQSCVLRSNDESGYVVASGPEDTGRGFKLNLRKINSAVTMFDADIINAVFEVVYHEDYHLQIKIYDADNTRYEVPIPLNLPTTADENPLYQIQTTNNPFSFTVTRNSTGAEIFKTFGPIIFENQFLEISTLLSSEYVYGLGENPHAKFKHSFTTTTTVPIFPRDQPVGTGNFNQYGYQPYFMTVEDDSGSASSVLLRSSNAMEYSTFTTSYGQPAITLRTIGGIIDLHLFLGPTMEDVNSQYATAIGKPAFPPYFALGFHLSRYGYNTLDNLKTVRQRMKDLQIPQDVQTADIDYMYHWRDFTYDDVNWAGFPEYIDEMHADGVKITMMLDPAIVADFTDNYPSAKHGYEQDVYIKWLSSDLVPADQLSENEDYIVGYVWPDNKTVFPDFLNPSAHSWWGSEIQTFHETLDFDAIWIDMNEPANFGTNMDRPFNYPDELPDWSLKCPYTDLDDPPFPTKATYQTINECQRLSDKTICMSSLQTDGTLNYTHYDVHSLYGISETIATEEAMELIFPGQKHLILSRSTYPGSGKYASHWLGDNDSDWLQMKQSIVGLLEFAMFGIPHNGADICGFFNDATEELCTRWTQLGAFYPFSRNHNTIGSADQDPASPRWSSATHDIMRDVLMLRYKYIPYLNTLFHKSHMHGYTVVRPLMNVFPDDLLVRDLDDQFMWGSGLMIAPILIEGDTSRSIYFPEARWYDLVDGTLTTASSQTLTVDSPIEKIPVYIRGGYILPYQQPNVTTTLSRQNYFGLTVALDSNGESSGDLYWDDGITALEDMSSAFMGFFDFTANVLAFTIMHGETLMDSYPPIESVEFYGYPGIPIAIDINGNSLDSSTWNYDVNADILTVYIYQSLGTEFNMTIT